MAVTYSGAKPIKPVMGHIWVCIEEGHPSFGYKHRWNGTIWIREERVFLEKPEEAYDRAMKGI